LRDCAAQASDTARSPALDWNRSAPRELVIGGRVYRLIEQGPGASPGIHATRPDARRGGLGELLTPRELQVAALVAMGRANKQIASELGISEWTVSTHLRRIFSKLGVDSRAAMVAQCFGGKSSS
jgi:DNA-binding CsgD family transcriptional regulator